MITRKHLLLAIAATCLLTMFLLTVVPIRSQTAGQYDPWLDANDDGKIDGKDIALPALIYGTAGDPINKTALLLELQAQINSLNATVMEQQNTINNLNSTVVELQNTTDYLNTTVNYLNQTVILLNSTKGLGIPDYDSGWVGLPTNGVWFTHNLNTTNVFIYLLGKGSSGNVHQHFFGGDDSQYGARGAFVMDLNNNAVMIYRAVSDIDWVQVRIMIWKIQ